MKIEFVGGGPADGAKKLHPEKKLPPDGWEVTFNKHSYTFDSEALKFRYRGRWRNITIRNSLLTYRTFGEAARQLCQLQFSGAISAKECLDFQALVKMELGGCREAN